MTPGGGGLQNFADFRLGAAAALGGTHAQRAMHLIRQISYGNGCHVILPRLRLSMIALHEIYHSAMAGARTSLLGCRLRADAPFLRLLVSGLLLVANTENGDGLRFEAIGGDIAAVHFAAAMGRKE